MAHSREAIRIDCLELVCVNPKLSEPPGKLELEVGVGLASRFGSRDMFKI
jgi:hypothetical protein